ncbi:Annexin A7 [Echinococcus granulosus]|uniref:Annexin A7 n=1 Tax=Echinococcus granulosus TaxID=6210 RepID=W6UEP1_ECHGR|nr:Annexin A7 [Echinococcus granulosus]EUB59910.1 Annexin A7 [Echinococcus granulosus]
MAGYPPPVGFNTNLDAPAGYPPQGPMGFPPQGGYPPQGGQMGYPPQGQMGYPPQGQMGYPPQGPMGQLPPQGQMGYPPYGGQPGYGGAPPPQGGYTNGYGPPQPMGLGYGAGAVAGPSGSCGGGAAMGFLSIYYSGRPTVVPMPCFNPCDDAENLRKAMRGLGTDEGCIIAVLSKRTCGQRSEIAKKYKASFGKDVGLFSSPKVRYAEDKNALLATWFYESMVGIGTRDKALMQLVLGRCEIDLQDVKEAYQRKYGKCLVKAIENDTSGDYKRMLVALVGP